MTLATKNGAIIVKDGQLAEDCACCGGWYCYKCEDGFAVDCRNFGTIAINGNSSFEPRLSLSATSAGVGGCFEVQSGTLFQRSSSTLCELWSIAPGFDDCNKQYLRWSILPPGTNPRFLVYGGEQSVSEQDDRIQSRLSVVVAYAGTDMCGDVRIQYRLIIGVQWELWIVAHSSSGNLWAGSLMCSESYSTTRFITASDMSAAGNITIPTSSVFTTTPWRVVHGNVLPALGIVSPRPPDMDIVLTPTIYPARCNTQ